MIVKVYNSGFDHFGTMVKGSGAVILNKDYDPYTMDHGVFKLDRLIVLDKKKCKHKVLTHYEFKYRDLLHLPEQTNAVDAVQMQLERPDMRVRVGKEHDIT